MANAISIASIIAKEALVIVDNNLSGIINSFHRDKEADYLKNVKDRKSVV